MSTLWYCRNESSNRFKKKILWPDFNESSCCGCPVKINVASSSGKGICCPKVNFIWQGYQQDPFGTISSDHTKCSWRTEASWVDTTHGSNWLRTYKEWAIRHGNPSFVPILLLLVLLSTSAHYHYITTNIPILFLLLIDFFFYFLFHLYYYYFFITTTTTTDVVA